MFALQKDIGDEFKINPSAITALIARMEDSGLVERQPSSDDARSIRIFATPDGLDKARAARPILARLNGRLMAGFTQNEIETVARFLESIVDRF
ncbi:MAG TPA: MarR family transcriptional regulator [Blastocatellia bacterium]